MNQNPIEELRRMETPVTEEGWTSIVNDRRYARKFGQKSGLSPKGRAALIAAAAAVLVTVPILVKTLTHSEKETAQADIPATEKVQTASETDASPVAMTTTEIPSATDNSAKAGATPAKITVTEQSAKHECSTMASVIAKRQQVTDNESIEDWPPVLNPEPDGSRLTYNQIKAVPERSQTPALQPSQDVRIVHSCSPGTKGNPSVCETTVTVDGEVVTKYDYSSEEPVAETEQFFIPSAFTPNGDGLNDLFLVKANFEPRGFELTVLNRAGEPMFQTRDINIGWDGHFRGKLLPQGVYVCIIKYKDREGNEHKQQGQVLLIP